MTIELHPHQFEAVQKMHNGCVLWGGVGTGKTITALAYALEKEPDRDIVVVTTAKKRDSADWEQEAALLMVKPDRIEVTSWNKINEHKDTEGKFFIFDEQRLVGAGAWVKAFYKIARKNHWILLSATPGDTWSDYAPMFIANGWYKNITEFRREHAIYSRYTTFPKIEKWIGEGKLVKFRKRLLVEMPMIRHTTRHMHYIECDYDRETLDTVRKRRWNVYEDKPLKNAAELYGVMRKVVSSDPDRRSKMAQLVATHPRLIVFYNFNYELEILRGICQEISTTHALDGDISNDPSSKNNWQTSESGLVLPQNLEIQDLQGQPLEIVPERIETWESKEAKTSPETTPSTPSPLTNRETTQSSLTPEQLRLWWTQESRTAPSPMRTKSRLAGAQLGKTLHPVETPSSPVATSAAISPSSPSPTDAWSGTIWEDDQTPEVNFRMQRAKYNYEAHERKGEWLKNSNPSSMSMIYPKSRLELDESLSSSGTIGTTKTSSDSTSLPDISTGSFGWAEWNGHKHQPIPDTDRWVYLVQYASGSEGWNCVSTDAMAFWSLTYSWKQFNQAQGRIDRLNTPFEDLHYHVLMTESVAEKPVIRSLEQKKDFQPKM